MTNEEINTVIDAVMSSNEKLSSPQNTRMPGALGQWLSGIKSNSEAKQALGGEIVTREASEGLLMAFANRGARVGIVDTGHEKYVLIRDLKEAG